MVLFDQHRGLNVFYGFPHIVAFGVSQPLYEILQLFSPPMILVVADGLDFVLFVIIDKVRWGPGVVFSVLNCFDIWG